MTREEIEADIRVLEEAVSTHFWGGPACERLACTRRSLQIRRDMLAKLDGPAPGFVRARTYARVDGAGRYIIWEADQTGVMGKDEWPRWLAEQRRIEVFVDLPLPPVVEVEGEVEK